MNPDPRDDLGSAHEDRRDNRRAILVVLIAVVLFALACFVLLASQQRAGGRAAPAPSPTSSGFTAGQFPLE